ncbi:ABC transporter ATP-binding protein [Marinihelvus fidelis]|uniref:ABC transporter ATP-binding protein n=1 Tax=Marinihelvus fidelis TaxID=2613842 RepID=A0A5N0T9E4_9GAMM|nr:ABC transporter ATP-binding protein [Marinihelvus fidelis]KAA9131645.1 ABC transporter ATP-binding protein [Marinihelvus fidelis]
MTPVLEVRDLRVRFDTPDGEVEAVRGIDFDLAPGESLGVVGESGSGKTQAFMAILGLLAENGSATGVARYRGEDLMAMSPSELNRHRGHDIAMIFQDPMTALNPYLSIEKQMVEVVMHHQGLGHAEARAHAIEMLRAVRIPDPEQRIDQYPHEFSGGMRQRITIAMGLLCEPDILVADEPTTALDVTVQAQIARLVGDIARRSHMSSVLITHDLGAVAGVCDRVMVMYAGQVVETGSVGDIFSAPRHPYTQGLLASMPRLDRIDDVLPAIPGNPPNLSDIPAGCAFRARCSRAFEACGEPPPLHPLGGDRASRCHLEDAP